MADIYTVELDGVQYDIEGDRPPTEADVRAMVGNRGLPVPPDPRTFENQNREALADDALIVGDGNRNQSLGQTAFTLGAIGLAGPAGRLLSKIPAGRILTSGVAGTKAALKEAPLVGPPLREGAKAARTAWTASRPAAPSIVAPAATEAVAPALPAPKPKLNAQQVAEMLRKEHGSAKAGQMLYGPARQGLKAADRQAAIRRLTPTMESELPQAAQRAMSREIAASTPEEAFRYANRAPNAPAQSYIGDLLRRALLERMGK